MALADLSGPDKGDMSVCCVEYNAPAIADTGRAGGSRVETGVALALRAGSGRDPLGRAGRFVRKSVRNSAVQLFCESLGSPGCVTWEDEKNFKGDEERVTVGAKGC